MIVRQIDIQYKQWPTRAQQQPQQHSCLVLLLLICKRPSAKIYTYEILFLVIAVVTVGNSDSNSNCCYRCHLTGQNQHQPGVPGAVSQQSQKTRKLWTLIELTTSTSFAIYQLGMMDDTAEEEEEEKRGSFVWFRRLQWTHCRAPVVSNTIFSASLLSPSPPSVPYSIKSLRFPPLMAQSLKFGKKKFLAQSSNSYSYCPVSLKFLLLLTEELDTA